MIRRSTAFLSLISMGCSEIAVRPKKPVLEEYQPVIQVDPESIDFGMLTSAQDRLETITVTNTGFAAMDVDDVTLDGPGSFVFEGMPPLPLVLAPDESFTFDVAFRPREGGDLTAEVVVFSNGINAPEFPVPITGIGAVADLVVSPDPVQFGEHFIPCDTSRLITFGNVGNEPLVVSDVSWGGDAEQFVIDGLPATPFTIQPGAELPWVLEFHPAVRGDADVSLDVTSNDPDVVSKLPVLAAARYGAEFSEQFEVPETFPVNILFAVDQSGSMSGEAATLAVEFSSFISTLSTATQDWKVGVVTMDDGCFNDGILTASTSNVTGLFSSAVQLGGDEQYYTERLLELVRRAIDLDVPGSCNHGFRDPGAPLHVIFVSDERDQSPQDWSVYWNAYTAYALDATLFTAHAVVDVNTTCGGSGASDSGPGGYLEIASSTAGQVLDICSSSWSAQLGWIAQQAVADVGVYELAQAGIAPDSLEVSVDGMPWTTDWHYDAGRHAVVFDVELEAGQLIDVQYGVSPNCP